MRNLITHFPERILMTADPISEVWTYCIDLCRKLGEYNIDVALAVMGKELSEEQIDEASDLFNVMLYQSTFKLEWMEDPWKDISTASRWLLSIKEKFRPDIVHLNCYSFGILNWEIPSLIVAHSDVYSWHQSVKKENPKPKLQRYFNKVIRGIRKANYLVTPSGYMMSVINKNYTAKKEQKVIYNARERSFFKPAKKYKYILGNGSIGNEAKNLVSLANVASRVEWPIYIYGDYNKKENGNSFRLSKINLKKNPSFNESRDMLSKAAIYTLPAKYEPSGISVLEAAMSGCALILGDIPSLKEIWGDAAIYVNPDNEKSLGDAINFLIKDDDFRKELSLKAYQRSKSFSIDKMCQEYLKVYNQLLTNQKIKIKTFYEN